MILLSYLVVTEKTVQNLYHNKTLIQTKTKINYLISAFLFCYYFVDYLLRICVWNYYQTLFQSNEFHFFSRLEILEAFSILVYDDWMILTKTYWCECIWALCGWSFFYNQTIQLLDQFEKLRIKKKEEKQKESFWVFQLIFSSQSCLLKLTIFQNHFYWCSSNLHLA